MVSRHPDARQDLSLSGCAAFILKGGSTLKGILIVIRMTARAAAGRSRRQLSL
jgi:hypothetical protein